MKRQLLTLVFLGLVSWNCSNSSNKEEAKQEPVEKTIPATPNADPSPYAISIIDGINGTFGYDILKDGKIFIHQPHMPGVSGNLGFAKREHAEKAAQLMIEKLQKNIIPPTISEDELQAIIKK